MAITKIVILGGGVAGLAAALALRRLQPQLPGLNVNVSIYEIRDSPSTIGGAINLTPNALRYLDHLGVLPKLSPRGCPVESIELFSQRTGRKLGELCFEATDQHKYGALRVQRGELLAAMLETAQESGVDVRYGKKAIEISLDDEGATICFQDGESAVADLLLGCDGIHSFTRSVIEPSRNPEYSGIATAYGLFDDDGTVGKQIPFISTGLWSGRRGSLMSSWTNPQKSKLYVAAVMETAEVASREGWKVKSTDHRAVKDDILNRFRNSSVPVLEVAIEGVENFFLYPVYKLPPHGQWSRGPALLLGDAAHAVSSIHRDKSYRVTNLNRCLRKARALGWLSKMQSSSHASLRNSSTVQRQRSTNDSRSSEHPESMLPSMRPTFDGRTCAIRDSSLV